MWGDADFLINPSCGSLLGGMKIGSMMIKGGTLHLAGQYEVIHHGGYIIAAIRYPETQLLEKMGVIGRRVVIHIDTPDGVVAFIARVVKEGGATYVYVPKALWPHFEGLHHSEGFMVIEVS
ncbi:hypothetical protein [Caldivirga sp.]|uniref:hypothetical protein n=1 Tax=Caldivirga sp. TaxID=2080243 RepID=UPI003D1309D3